MQDDALLTPSTRFYDCDRNVRTLHRKVVHGQHAIAHAHSVTKESILPVHPRDHYPPLFHAVIKCDPSVIVRSQTATNVHAYLPDFRLCTFLPPVAPFDCSPTHWTRHRSLCPEHRAPHAHGMVAWSQANAGLRFADDAFSGLHALALQEIGPGKLTLLSG